MNNELIELQSRLAFQEDTIQQLNLALSRQQSQIDNLQIAIKHLIKQVRGLEPAEKITGEHEIPPHY